jgi:hypothetical protein
MTGLFPQPLLFSPDSLPLALMELSFKKLLVWDK